MTAVQGVPGRGVKRLGQGIERQIRKRMRRPEGQPDPQGAPSPQHQCHSVAHCILQNKHPCLSCLLYLPFHSIVHEQLIYLVCMTYLLQRPPMR